MILDDLIDKEIESESPLSVGRSEQMASMESMKACPSHQPIACSEFLTRLDQLVKIGSPLTLIL